MGAAGANRWETASNIYEHLWKSMIIYENTLKLMLIDENQKKNYEKQ